MKRASFLAIAMLAMFAGSALAQQQPLAAQQQSTPRRAGGDNGGNGGNSGNSGNGGNSGGGNGGRNTNSDTNTTRVTVTIFNNWRHRVRVTITVFVNGQTTHFTETVRGHHTATITLTLGGGAAVTAVDVTPVHHHDMTFRGWRGHMTNPSAVHVGDDGSVDLS